MHPSFRLFPVLLGLTGGNQKLAPLELKQLLADCSRQPCVARRGRWGPRTPGERHRLTGLTNESVFCSDLDNVSLVR